MVLNIRLGPNSELEFIYPRLTFRIKFCSLFTFRISSSLFMRSLPYVGFLIGHTPTSLKSLFDPVSFRDLVPIPSLNAGISFSASPPRELKSGSNFYIKRSTVPQSRLSEQRLVKINWKIYVEHCGGLCTI